MWIKTAAITLSLAAVPACGFNVSMGGSNAGANTINVSSSSQSNESSNAPASEPASASAESQTATAAALVADLYKQHDAKKSPFFQTKNRALVDKFFTKPLADLIWKDANDSSGEVGAIDADPLYNTQDPDIKNFKVGQAEVKGESAKVPVTFTNYTQKVTVTFSLKTVNGAWKIDDIGYGGGDSLMKWLKGTYAEPSANPSPVGEFEGRYQVGETTCVVKPVKMAFEVRWARGSGVETFFYKDDNAFESEAGGDRNRFEFDDKNYNSGTFYRADGKTFAVKRAK